MLPFRFPDAVELDALVEANGSETMFMMTWRRIGDPPSAYSDLRGSSGGSVGYVPIAFLVDGAVAPAGWAFRRAVELDADADLWSNAKHPNAHGKYLAACVLYATFMRSSPAGLVWYPGRLSELAATFLQQLAADVVLTDLPGWNIPAP